MKAKIIFSALILALIGSAAYAVDVDGQVAQGEYAKEMTLDKGNFRLLWSVVGDKFFMAIEANATGWVSVGFDPASIMAKSDMIFGIVDASGSVKCIDAWSTGMFGPHPADTEQGGHDNMLAYAGKRSGNRVVFEFSRLLNTGDKFDKIIPAAGKIKAIWAYSSSLQFSAKHSKAGSIIIDTAR